MAAKKVMTQLQYSSIDELDQQAEIHSQISVHLFDKFLEYVLSFRIFNLDDFKNLGRIDTFIL